MTITLIECEDLGLLEAFKGSVLFEEICGPNPFVTLAKYGEWSEFPGLSWMLIEDEGDKDNITYRLTRNGLQFWSVGVVV